MMRLFENADATMLSRFHQWDDSSAARIHPYGFAIRHHDFLNEADLSPGCVHRTSNKAIN
jgi:hypothetical protein